MSRTGDLLLLQEIDLRADHDSARLVETEANIAGDPELERRRVQSRRLQRRRSDVDAQTAAQEAVVDGLRRRARELDRHLYDGSVHNPQELLGMQHELQGLRARVAAEEETQLELMEQAEAAATAERDAVAALVDREQERADGAGELSADAVAVRGAIEQHARDREALIATLDRADVALYERLRRRLRPVVVRLAGDTCGGCHLPFANSEVRAVRSGDAMVQCSGCDRIVVS